MKIFVSGIWDYTEGSLGAQALSDGLLTEVRKTFPNAQIYCPKQVFSKYFPEKILHNKLLTKLFKKQITAYFKSLYKRIAAENVKLIASANLVIISGDGIVTDIFPHSTLQLATEIELASDYGVRCISLNQSANFVRKGFVDYLFQRSFMRYPIQLREEDSFQFVKSMPNPHNVYIERGIDSAFLTKPLSQSEINYYDKELINPIYQAYGLSEKEYICISVRANRPKSQNINLKYWAEFFRHVQATAKKKLLYLSSANHLDKVNGIKLANAIDNLVIVNEFDDYGKYNYRVIERMIQKSAFSISDRYHQNVFSLLTNTPLISFEANTNKTQGLIDTMGYRGEILELPDEQNIVDLKRKFDFAWGNKDILDFSIVKKNIHEKNTYRQFLLNAQQTSI